MPTILVLCCSKMSVWTQRKKNSAECSAKIIWSQLEFHEFGLKWNIDCPMLCTTAKNVVFFYFDRVACATDYFTVVARNIHSQLKWNTQYKNRLTSVRVAVKCRRALLWPMMYVTDSSHVWEPHIVSVVVIVHFLLQAVHAVLLHVFTWDL